MSNNSKSFVEQLIDGSNILILALIAIVMIFPFYYVIAVSFASYKQYLLSNLVVWPNPWVLDAYHYIFSSMAFIRSIGVSIYVTVLGTILSLFISSTMSFSLTRKAPGQKLFLLFVLFTFVFNGGMIPTYMVVKATGLMNTLWSLIIPTASGAFAIIIMRQFIMNIPEAICDSALIDGANEWQIYWRIILPLTKPVLAAFGLFTAVTYWNTYFTAILYLSDSSKWTVQVILRQMIILNETMQALPVSRQAMENMVHPPPPRTIGMAAVVVATLPILLLYPFLQKHFAKGVMIGSIKE